VFLDFRDAIQRIGLDAIRRKYGNLFQMYEKITGDDPYRMPMRIYPAPHYTMGGLWVDYNLESTIPGLFVLGEANFSDHGANRLGASALMQGLADGYFVLPATVGGHLAGRALKKVSTTDAAFETVEREARERTDKLLSVNGRRSAESLHRELGRIMWHHCGMARNAQGLKQVREQIRALREEFWGDLRVLGGPQELNQSLEYAGRVADFMEFAELKVADALHREESCGGHFREEHQTAEGEALRDDERFAYAAAWEFQGVGADSALHKEALEYEYVHLTQRSYK
jgi:succinate dehydrogenase / fumarate reductase flavoprotein subunit